MPKKIVVSKGTIDAASSSARSTQRLSGKASARLSGKITQRISNSSSQRLSGKITQRVRTTPSASTRARANGARSRSRQEEEADDKKKKSRKQETNWMPWIFLIGFGVVCLIILCVYAASYGRQDGFNAPTYTARRRNNTYKQREMRYNSTDGKWSELNGQSMKQYMEKNGRASELLEQRKKQRRAYLNSGSR